MAYEKQNFTNGQVLTAECLNRMENGIKDACDAAPPDCDFKDCSKVLSYGKNGPEWVDMPNGGGGSVSGAVDYYSTTQEELKIPLDGGDTMTKTNITAENVILAYDLLWDTYPDRVTKNTLHSDGENSIVEYVISTGEYNTKGDHVPVDGHIKKPKYLIMSGVHGKEQSAIISTYKFICDVLSGHNIPSHFREGAVIHVMPVANPSSVFTTVTNGKVTSCGDRENANGVNIERNFDWNWRLATADEISHGNNSGTKAMSELETQVIAKWLEANQDAELFLDVHNSGYINEISNILGLEDHVKRIAMRGLDRVIPYWRKSITYSKCNMAKTESGSKENTAVKKDVIFSYSSSYNPFGTAYCYATDKLGIPGMSLEMPAYVGEYNYKLYSNGGNTNSVHPHEALTHAVGAETIGNIILEFFANPGSSRRDVLAMIERTEWLQSSMLANMDEAEKTFEDIVKKQSPMIGGN